MTSAQRREKIMELLSSEREPVSASAIARLCSVSRQIIVGDVALLRAGGAGITATPRGYVLDTGAGLYEQKIACRHTADKILEELYLIVDLGGEAADVTVEHSVYGQISGQLNISSRYEADLFYQNLLASQSRPLCDLTGGVHLHTIRCRSQAAFERIEKALSEKGFLLKKE